MAMNKAQKRYTKSILLLMSGYALILIGVVSYAKNAPLHGPLGYIAALLPALPVIGVFFAMGRYLVAETDEYLRTQFARQALIATGLMLSIATAWGFLENFGLVPHVYAYYAATLWFGGMGVGAYWNKLAARRGGES
jgi:hypothetical protein